MCEPSKARNTASQLIQIWTAPLVCKYGAHGAYIAPVSTPHLTAERAAVNRDSVFLIPGSQSARALPVHEMHKACKLQFPAHFVIKNIMQQIGLPAPENIRGFTQPLSTTCKQPKHSKLMWLTGKTLTYATHSVGQQKHTPHRWWIGVLYVRTKLDT